MASSKLNKFDICIIVLAVVALIFSFTARFDFPFTRLFGVVWNLGHVVAFYIWTYLCLRFIKPLKNLSLLKQTLILVFSAAVFGCLIEVAQIGVGRDAEIGDIISDLLGTGLAILLHSNRIDQLPLKMKPFMLALLFSATMFLHKNIFIVPFNDYFTYQQFPVLINPATPFEKTKIETTKIEYLKALENNSDTYFKIIFSTARYSTLMMGFFPLDWNGYEYLEIELYNPEPENLSIVCRIHDLPHIYNDYDYNDRYSKRFNLAPGENLIKIAIPDIVNAPLNREMNLQKMAAVGLFMTDADRERELHLYKMQLSRMN